MNIICMAIFMAATFVVMYFVAYVSIVCGDLLSNKLNTTRRNEEKGL